MDVVAIIPARMSSSRYPGKPLADIEGFSMVEHVYRRTAMSEIVDETYVATPNEEIEAEVESFGGNVIMTGPNSRAVDRVAEAARELDAEIVTVVQGDEPLVYPEMVDDAVEPLLDDESITCTNLAKEIETEAAFRDPNNVKVVVDSDWKALCFSREPIPNLHDTDFAETRVYKQVCVIPFRREKLFEFVEMEDTPLESAEGIDMMKLLENGHDVQLVETDYPVYAVDTPEDHEKVNEMMRRDDLYQEYAEPSN